MNLLEKYSKTINELSNLKGVYGLYIFGSYAKNKQSKKSDLDICFLVDSNNKELIREIISNKTDEFDLNVLSQLSLSIQFEIIKTGKIFSITDEIKFKEQKMYVLRRYKDESWVFKNAYFRRYGVEV